MEVNDNLIVRSEPLNTFNLNISLITFSIVLYVLLFIQDFCQQFIFTFPGFKPFVWNLYLGQFFIFAFCGWLEMMIKKKKRSVISLNIYATLGLLILCRIYFSSYAITYLNYPMYVTLEFVEIFAVLLAGIYVLKKRYNLVHYLSIILLCIGLSAFILTNTHMAAEFHTLGVAVMVCSLVCTGLIFTFEEKILVEDKCSNAELIFCIYLFSSAYLMGILLSFGNFWNGTIFLIQDKSLMLVIAVYSVCSFLSLHVILSLIQNSDALVTTIIISYHKPVVVISQLLYFETKSFSITYIWSGALVICGVYLNFIAKNYDTVTVNSVFSILIRNLKSFHCRGTNKEIIV